MNDTPMTAMHEAGPLVTVVTPSYNYGRFLGACLESVRRQSYPNIEHIVLDACSTDETPAVLASFANTYRLRSVRERDAGQADALNNGFGLAHGDIFCWLNADDYWLHERVVEEAVRALHEGADVVTAGGEYVDGDGQFLADIAVSKEPVATELRYYDPLLQPSTFWRRDVHLTLNSGYRYAFDWKLFLGMAASGATIQVLDKRWAAYRLHGQNKTAVDPPERRAEIARILGDQWGIQSLQYRWARGVYWGFKAAQDLHLPILKWGACKANGAMKRLSNGRVCSS